MLNLSIINVKHIKFATSYCCNPPKSLGRVSMSVSNISQPCKEIEMHCRIELLHSSKNNDFKLILEFLCAEYPTIFYLCQRSPQSISRNLSPEAFSSISNDSPFFFLRHSLVRCGTWGSQDRFFSWGWKTAWGSVKGT